MKCIHCNEEIVLVPSAAERAAKDPTGKPASYYTNLFREHSECALARRAILTSHTMTWARKEIPRIDKPKSQHLYRLNVGSGRHLDVEANNRDQAGRIAESYGYEVHDCNMIG